MEVVSNRLVVEESVREAKIPLRRTGDISQRLYVTCVTRSFIEEGMLRKILKMKNKLDTSQPPSFHLFIT